MRKKERKQATTNPCDQRENKACAERRKRRGEKLSSLSPTHVVLASLASLSLSLCLTQSQQALSQPCPAESGSTKPGAFLLLVVIVVVFFVDLFAPLQGERRKGFLLLVPVQGPFGFKSRPDRKRCRTTDTKIETFLGVSRKNR